MSPDEAREVFSEAFEGDLEEERQEAFDAALEADEELKGEYEDFVDTFQMMGMLATEESVRAPNLLPRIQERIRRRSGGRYYRDRFAKRAGGPGWAMPVIAAVALLIMLGIVLYAMQTTVMLEDAQSTSGESTTESSEPAPTD